MNTLEVNVTEKNIAEGEHLSINSCPIAKAINSSPIKFPQNKYSSVHLTDGWFSRVEKAGEKATKYAFKLPEIAQQFIRDWQDKKECQPISFTLELESKGQAEGCGSI